MANSENMPGWTRRALLSHGLASGLGVSTLSLGACVTPTGPRELTPVGPYLKRLVRIKGNEIAFVEIGQGPPIVFLHGSPTSSYLWRNIIPYAEPYGRCIAPDLLGMGDSAKLKKSGPGSYSFAQQAEMLDYFLDRLRVRDNVVLVGHGWGAALAFHWAEKNPDAIMGIAHSECYFLPLEFRMTVQKRPPVLEIFDQNDGQRYVLYGDTYLDKILFAPLEGHLKRRDIDAYRKPFRRTGEDRRPLLTWAQQVPYAGQPADTWDMIASYTDWLPNTTFKKLHIYARQGTVMRGYNLKYAAGLPNQRLVPINSGHYVPEEAPQQFGEALQSWLNEDLGLPPQKLPEPKEQEVYRDEINTGAHHKTGFASNSLRQLSNVFGRD